MDVYALLGKHSDVGVYIDSTMYSPFHANRVSGVAYLMTVDDTVSFLESINYRPFPEIIDSLKRSEFHNDTHIDSLNGLLRYDWKIHTYPERWSIYETVKDRYLIKKLSNSGQYQIDKRGWAIDKMQGHGWAVFKTQSKVSFASILMYKPSLSSLSSDLIWSKSDISQAYVIVDLSGFHKTYMKNESIKSDQYSNVEEVIENLFIDFGSPISVSGMLTEPDRKGMTYIQFNQPSKIREIFRNGLVFHVKFLHNENIQNIKLFWITTIITALLTWLVTILFKWIRWRGIYR